MANNSEICTPDKEKKRRRKVPTILSIVQGTTNTRACFVNALSGDVMGTEDFDFNILQIIDFNVKSVMETAKLLRPVSRNESSDSAASPALSSILSKKYLLPEGVAHKISELVRDDTRDDVTGLPRHHEILKRMPHGEELYALRDDPEFGELALRHWIRHLEHIKECVDQLCEANDFDIVKIAVPRADRMKDEEVDKIMLGIIARVFGLDIPVVWVGETEAIAHHIVENDRGLLEGRPVLLVVDVGRTRVNACVTETFELVSRGGGRAPNVDVLLAKLEQWGGFGGSEQVEMLISDAFKRNIKLCPDLDPETVDFDEVHKFFLSKFHNDGASLDPRRPVFYTMSLDPDRWHSVCVRSEDIDVCFEKAYMEVFDTIRREGGRVIRQHRDNVAVVFSGDRTRSQAMRDFLEEFIADTTRDMELDEPLVCKFADDFPRLQNRDGIVAEGTAIAAKKAHGKSLATMVANGATFGARFIDLANEDGGNEQEILPLYGYNSPPNARDDYNCRVEGQAQLKIICDGFMGTKRPDNVYVDTNYCYDVFVVPREDTTREGRYLPKIERFERRRRGEGEDVFRFTLDYRHRKRRERKVWELPLSLDVGASRVLVDPERVEETEWRRLPGSK